MKSLKFLTHRLQRFCTNQTERIKSLREFTGAPLMKCKEALEKFANIEDAKNYLREKNLIMAEKKANNIAAEGVLALSVLPSKIIVAKVNSETDFVAKNQEFLNFVQEAIKALQNFDGEFQAGSNKLSAEILQNIKTGETNLLEKQKMITAKIQENIKVSEVFIEPYELGHLVGTYIHNALRENFGMSLGYVIVEFQGSAQLEKIQELANDLAVHIFCKSPNYISFDSIPKMILETRIEEIKNSLDDSFTKKPKEIQDKIIEGKIKKAFDDEILLDQVADFWNTEKTVDDCLKNFAIEHKTTIKIKKFNSLKIK